MKAILNTQVMLSIHLLVIAGVISVAAWSINNSETELRNELNTNIDRQVVLLNDLVELTGRNGADEVVSKIIIDCPNRPKFEEMLGRLASLNYQELITVQQLLESCGGFYAERKAVMVSRIEREYEVLLDNVHTLSILDESVSERSLETNWGLIVELELQRSALLAEQVVIQRDIIKELIAGSNVRSSVVGDKAARAQDISELLTVLDNKIVAARTEVVEN